MELEEKIYQTGFNAGYYIKSYSPILFEKLAKGVDSDNPYLEGFVNGGNEHTLEIRLKSISNLKSNDPTNNRER